MDIILIDNEIYIYLSIYIYIMDTNGITLYIYIVPINDTNQLNIIGMTIYCDNYWDVTYVTINWLVANVTSHE